MNGLIGYFGTAASVVVAISLTQKNIKRLRILNLIGAMGFAVYGFLISAWPVLGLNAFIAVIDAYYLIEMHKRENYFELLEIEEPSRSVYLRKFLDFYNDDIAEFMPEFDSKRLESFKAVFILRDLLPDSQIEIIVDYAIPAYRDMKNASYFFDKIAETFIEGETLFITAPGSNLHNKYLEKIGFSFSNERNRYLYRK